MLDLRVIAAWVLCVVHCLSDFFAQGIFLGLCLLQGQLTDASKLRNCSLARWYISILIFPLAHLVFDPDRLLVLTSSVQFLASANWRSDLAMIEAYLAKAWTNG